MMRSTMTYLASGTIWGIAAFFLSGALAWGGEPQGTVRNETFPTLEEVYDHLKKDREILIGILREYAKKGYFPHGEGASVPVSKKDPHFDSKRPTTHRILGPNGALCALAYLISKSGGEKLVNELSKTDNHFCVGKDRNEAVTKWILSSGLTLEECVRIQWPGFAGGRQEREPPGLPVWTPEMENVARIQTHLLKVAAELEKNTKKSLRIALERLDKAKS